MAASRWTVLVPTTVLVLSLLIASCEAGGEATVQLTPEQQKVQDFLEACTALSQREVTVESSEVEACEDSDDEPNEVCRYEFRRFKDWWAPPCHDLGKPTAWDWRYHCLAPKAVDALGQAHRKADLLFQKKVPWADDATTHFTFAIEKESHDVAIMNLYKPEWVNEGQWTRWCPQDTVFCFGRDCKNACVRSHEQGTFHTDFLACTNHRAVNDAIPCLEKLFGRYPAHGGSKDDTIRDFFKFIRMKTLMHCASKQDKIPWTDPRQRPNSTRQLKKDLPKQLGECYAEKLEAMREWFKAPYVYEHMIPETDESPLLDIGTYIEIVEWAEYVSKVDKRQENKPVQTFSDFKKFTEALPFMKDQLTQENSDQSWEINSKLCENTVSHVMVQTAFLQSWFGNNNNLHTHIVFERPNSNQCDCPTFAQNDCSYTIDSLGLSLSCNSQGQRKGNYLLNEGIAALASQLNDYAGLTYYALNVFNQYLRVWDSKETADLKKILASGPRAIDRMEDMSDGHNWGTWKNSFIAMRGGIYGNSALIGFEVRSGASPSLNHEQVAAFLSTNHLYKAAIDPHGAREQPSARMIVNIINTLHGFRVTEERSTPKGRRKVSSVISATITSDPIHISTTFGDPVPKVEKDAEDANESEADIGSYNIADLIEFQNEKREVGFETFGLKRLTPAYDRLCWKNEVRVRRAPIHAEDAQVISVIADCNFHKKRDRERWMKGLALQLSELVADVTPEDMIVQYSGGVLGDKSKTKFMVSFKEEEAALVKTLMDNWDSMTLNRGCNIYEQPTLVAKEVKVVKAPVEEKRPNPEGCGRIGRTDPFYYPMPWLRMTYKLYGESPTAAERCNPGREKVYAFYKKYPDVTAIENPERLAEQCAETCSDEGSEESSDELGVENVENAADPTEKEACLERCEKDKEFTKEVAECFEQLWTRWSFGLFLPHEWADFFGAEVEGPLRGATVPEEVDDLYDRFIAFNKGGCAIPDTPSGVYWREERSYQPDCYFFIFDMLFAPQASLGAMRDKHFLLEE